MSASVEIGHGVVDAAGVAVAVAVAAPGVWVGPAGRVGDGVVLAVGLPAGRGVAVAVRRGVCLGPGVALGGRAVALGAGGGVGVAVGGGTGGLVAVGGMGVGGG